jgi:hypothetical protein
MSERQMIAIELIAAAVITLSLGAMLHADTRDMRIRVRRED